MEAAGCSVCQKTPAKVCQCNGEQFCEKHLKRHLKSEGNHQVVDPEEVKVEVSDKKPKRTYSIDRKRTKKLDADEPRAPVTRKTLTKADYVTFLQAELAKVQRFRETCSDAIALQAERLVGKVVAESKDLIRDITRVCGETEEPLTAALQILQALPAEEQTIPLINPVLVRLYEARDQEGYEMLAFRSEIHELAVDFKGQVTYAVEWAPVASMVEMRHYFDTNKATMHPNIQTLFETILAEQHYTCETLILSKSALSEHSGADHLAIALPYFTQVKELRMGGNSLGVDEARTLFPIIGRMTGLTKLHLQKNDLKASGGRELSLVIGNLTHLRDLDLSGNNLGAEGIRLIAGVMKKLPNLKQLHLQDNNLGSESAKHLASGLRVLKGLKTLHLEGNNFTTEEMRTISNSNASGCKIQFNKS